jgi:hypothetical protein
LVTRVKWNAVLAGDLAAEAVQVARDVSTRLSNPQVLSIAVNAALAQTAFPQTVHWAPYSVAQGYSGLALLWSYLDSCFPFESWDLKGKDDLQRATRGAECVAGLAIGIFSGLSAVAFAAWQLSRDGTRYKSLLAQLDSTIVPQAMTLAYGVQRNGGGVNMGEFDAISGLSGVGAYLLCRRDQPRVRDALLAIAEALTHLLAEPRDGLPRWYTPPEQLYDDRMRETYPFGNLNCGLAHGVPSIVAFLSLCLKEGIGGPELPQALERISDWLCQSRSDDGWGLNWPNAVSIERVETASGPRLQVANAALAPHGGSRSAWCYGSPGVARALWLAGDALGRSDYQELGLEAMYAVFRRPVEARAIPSPTFCHGIAGLLQIALRFANDSGSPEIAEQCRELARQLLERYSPDSLLGFRNLEFNDREVDQPGLLDGAPGVALVLLAAASEVEPSWDRLFLLS